MSLWKYGVEAFVTLFVIMDPPGAAPIFLALVADETRKRRNQLALQASLVAFSVISLFALFGQFILRYLNISLPAMQGAGGLLLLLVSLELLTGKDSTSSASSGVNIALVPLGTPLLAGPGAIVATIIFVRRIELILRSSTVVMNELRESGVTWSRELPASCLVRSQFK